MHPISEETSRLTDSLISTSISKTSTEEKLSVMAMTPMFTFWEEIRTVMLQASEEMKSMRERIAELERSRDAK